MLYLVQKDGFIKLQGSNMIIERLKRIIEYSDANNQEIERLVQEFYDFAGLGYDKELRNVMQITRPVFNEKNYLVLRIPFSDKEIGALCYKGDALNYVLVNTSLPKGNVNFAICHELYHVFCNNENFKSKVEFAGDKYYENDQEIAANLFAGMILMPENSFRIMYSKFIRESRGEVLDTILRLMSYYQAPYMAVMIRCIELSLIPDQEFDAGLLDVSNNIIKNRFEELWLDTDVLIANKSDDFKNLTKLMAKVGTEFVEDGYLKQRALTKVLQNVEKIYSQIKEE